MPTDYRKYPTVPNSASPDVPYHVNAALQSVDEDVHEVLAQVDGVRTGSAAVNLAVAKLDAKYSGIGDIAVEASRTALDIKKRADAGEFQGLPGVNAVPADTAVGTYINNASSAAGKAVAAQVAAGTRPLLDAGDPFAYLNRIKHFLTVPARPAGTLWPQGFSVNASESKVYVAYNGSIDGGANSILRICIYGMDGVMQQSKDLTVEDATSSEGLPWFRNAANELCFIVRPATGGRGYAVYNFSKGTQGPVISLPGGNYKSAVSGDYFYTVDSNDSTNGFSRVFVWTWESIKAQAPVLVNTIIIDTPNRMEKVQSFAVNAGCPVFNHGASKSNIYLSAYTPNGAAVAAYELDRVGFAAAVNAGAPGTVINTGSYRHESEGAWVHEGRLLTGHVLDNNTTDYKFVIVAHNTLDGRRVEAKPVPLAHDTDWQPLQINAPFTAWNDATAPRIRRRNGVVYVDGAVKGLEGSPGVNVLVANVGRDFAPSRQLELPIQESSQAGYASWKVRPDGNLVLSETTVPAAGAGTWFPFTFSWLVG